MKRLFLRGSLRFRLLVGTLIWIAATLVTAGWGLGRLFQEHVTAQFHAELKIHLDQLTGQIDLDADGQLVARARSSDPRLGQPLSGLYWQIDQLAGAGVSASPAVLRSRSLWDQTLAVAPDAIVAGDLHRHRIEGPQGTILGVVERSVDFEGRRLRLIVAADERLMLEPVGRFKGQLWLALGVLGAGLALAAWMQVRVALAPLRRMSAALSAVRDGSAHRMEGRYPSEIMPLVTEFNHVLTQNAAVVERARTQAGNLAHALKTPLSVLAIASSAPERRTDEFARLVAAQVETARRQVDYHLSRARSAAGRSQGMRTAVTPVVDALVRTMQRLHADRDLTLTAVPTDGRLLFRGEENDLQEMLGNLIDNACKWAASRVEIRADREIDRLTITIDDDGKGIRPDQRAALRRRGTRADEQVPGTGLGLAIVDDLAHMYGGALALSESPSGGVRARLTLPAV